MEGLDRVRYNSCSRSTCMHRASFVSVTLLAGAALLAPCPTSAQKLIRTGISGGDLYLSHSDVAVLGAEVTRNDLPCTVEPLDPKLEYDLTFQAGYVARVPLAALAGSGNELRMLFRIQSLDSPDSEPMYFKEHYEVPSIEADAEGEATLPGKYRLGPGRYKVSWLMRDRSEKVCAQSWEVRAETLEGFEKLAASPDATKISEWSEEIFVEDPPIRRAAGKLLHVKLLVSFSPVDLAKVKLSEYDTRAVVSMLRVLAREPQIGEFSLVAYNAHEERVIYETSRTTRIDFKELGEAVHTSISGMVNIEQLQDKESGEKFVKSLFQRHLTRKGVSESDDKEPPDAIVFLGPKVVFEKPASSALLAESARLQVPVFYFIYNRNPRSYPWRDAVSAGLKNFNIKEFDITGAKDFGRSMQEWVELLSHLRKEGS
jgi:hypothetical protein